MCDTKSIGWWYIKHRQNHTIVHKTLLWVLLGKFFFHMSLLWYKNPYILYHILLILANRFSTSFNDISTNSFLIFYRVFGCFNLLADLKTRFDHGVLTTNQISVISSIDQGAHELVLRLKSRHPFNRSRLFVQCV
jgi:hypothetical protein